MPLKKFDQEVIGAIKAFLGLSWSYSDIIKHYKRQNITISRAYISKINNQKENIESNCENKPRGPISKVTKRRLNWLRKQVL